MNGAPDAFDSSIWPAQLLFAVTPLATLIIMAVDYLV